MKKKTFWPYGILLSIFAIVCACGYTIYYSLDYPVYIDDFYFDKYQNVENNFNEIQLAQAKFNERVNFSTQPEILINGEKNSNEPEILRKKKVASVINLGQDISLIFDTNASNLDGEILLTRPHTSKFDKKLSFNLKDKKFIVENFKIDDPGRWSVKIKVADNSDSIGFYSIDLYAK